MAFGRPPSFAGGGGGGGPNDSHRALAMMFGIVAAFLWANELFALTEEEFRAIAIANYGMAPLHILELAYKVFLHIAVFVATRAAVEIALTAIIAAGAYRFAF